MYGRADQQYFPSLPEPQKLNFFGTLGWELLVLSLPKHTP